MPGHTEQFARLNHPSKSWCARLEGDEKYLDVRFNELKVITGLATKGHPLEYKHVKTAKIQALVDLNWEIVKSSSNNDVSLRANTFC